MRYKICQFLKFHGIGDMRRWIWNAATSSKLPTFVPLSDPEAKILDYQTQQHKLFPQLAAAYALHFLANGVLEFFNNSYSAILDRDFSLLPEVLAVC